MQASVESCRKWQLEPPCKTEQIQSSIEVRANPGSGGQNRGDEMLSRCSSCTGGGGKGHVTLFTTKIELPVYLRVVVWELGSSLINISRQLSDAKLLSEQVPYHSSKVPVVSQDPREPFSRVLNLPFMSNISINARLRAR